MAQRYDKLGRRIPEFDRSAANKQGAKTKKEKYGPDYHAGIGANGGRARKRGYFGKLKDEGKTAELREIQRRGAETTNEAKRLSPKVRKASK